MTTPSKPAAGATNHASSGPDTASAGRGAGSPEGAPTGPTDPTRSAAERLLGGGASQAAPAADTGVAGASGPASGTPPSGADPAKTLLDAALKRGKTGSSGTPDAPSAPTPSKPTQPAKAEPKNDKAPGLPNPGALREMLSKRAPNRTSLENAFAKAKAGQPPMSPPKALTKAAPKPPASPPASPPSASAPVGAPSPSKPTASPAPPGNTPAKAAAPDQDRPAKTPTSTDGQSTGGGQFNETNRGGFSSVELQSIRSDFPILHQDVNGHPLAWLDNAATTQKPSAVMDALTEFYEYRNSNVHRGAHALAARATDAYEESRSKMRGLLKAESDREIVFCRGTTEAINLVAQSYGGSVLKPGDEVLVATLEHHANIIPWQMICRATGALLRPIPITDAGEIDLNAYLRMLGPKTKIVGLAHVSNVLGTVLPIREMTAMAHAVGARVLIDGAQGVAHMPVDMQEIGCDFYVFSGHKIYGPTGVGVLYGRLDLLDSMPPWQGGGNMIDKVRFDHTTYAPVPAKFEAGTPILAGAVGLGAAVDYVQKIGMERVAQHEKALLEDAMARLAQIPELTLYGTAPNKAAVAAFTIEGINTEKVGVYLDKKGIAVRVGHHCAQPTMDRYGVTGMVRPSFAIYNTFEEVDRLLDAITSLIAENS